VERVQELALRASTPPGTRAEPARELGNEARLDPVHLLVADHGPRRMLAHPDAELPPTDTIERVIGVAGNPAARQQSEAAGAKGT
jgi:hypothetical protein